MATTLAGTPDVREGTDVAVPITVVGGRTSVHGGKTLPKKAVAVTLVGRRTGVSDLPVSGAALTGRAATDGNRNFHTATSIRPPEAADLITRRTGIAATSVLVNRRPTLDRAPFDAPLATGSVITFGLTAMRTGISDARPVADASLSNEPLIAWHAATHRGLVRRQNEDSLCALVSGEDEGMPRYLLAVADGLGGHRSGFLASKIALEVMRREFQAWHGGSADHLLGRAMRRANEEVFSAAYVRSEFSGMQTTLTAAAIEAQRIAVGHVGDCRLYRLRNGQMEVLTRDHTKAGSLVQMRAISSQEVKEHPDRHRLTRSLGNQPFVRIDVFKDEVTQGDVYLLCSDGLWSNLPDEEISMALQDCQPEAACRELFAQALKDGGSDNMSAIVFRVATVPRASIRRST